VVRTAKAMAQSPDLDEELLAGIRQSLPAWDAQVRTAQSRLWEALRVEWAGDAPAEQHSLLETLGNLRARRLRGNWKRSLACVYQAHLALFQFFQSLRRLLEGYWSGTDLDEVPATSLAGAKEFFDQAEEFVVSRLVNLLAVAFPALQNLAVFVLAGLLLMLLAVTSYPFEPRNEFLFFNWLVILAFVGTVSWIFVQMERNTVLSLLNGTKPGQISFSRDLVVRAVLYIAVPLLALLGAQFPASVQQILSLFTTSP